jgi:phosphate transport system permease protein
MTDETKGEFSGGPAVRGPGDLSRLDRSLLRRRTLLSFSLSIVCGVLSVLAAVPLASVLFMLAWRGGAYVRFSLLTQLPPAAGMVGGGIGNAILGTFLVIAIGAAISIPSGILTGIYLAEMGDGPVSSLVRFCAKMLSGLPSILAGVFAYSSVVLLTGHFSPLAGGVALSLLMLPTIVLTTENAIRGVPAVMREAAIGLGATRTQVIRDILLPSAAQGVLTGVLLAIARGAGETAPLLFTMTFSDYWLTRHWMEPTASLAVLIYNFSKSPFDNQKGFAWAASLVLVMVVLALTMGGQALTRHARR